MAGVFEDEDAGDPKAFAAWATQLCDFVASSKGSPEGGRVMAETVFELLQNLAAAISRAERSVVREHQRRLEDTLIDILLSGTTPPVRSQHCVSSPPAGSCKTITLLVAHGWVGDVKRIGASLGRCRPLVRQHACFSTV